MKRIQGSLAVACAAMLLTTARSPGQSIGLMAEADADACSLVCADHPDGTQHIAWWPFGDYAFDKYGGGSHDHYWPGSCPTKHQECGPVYVGGLAENTGVRDAAEVLIEARDRGPAAVAAVLKNIDADRVVLNVPRSAVQLLNCAGEVYAHIPVEEIHALASD